MNCGDSIKALLITTGATVAVATAAFADTDNFDMVQAGAAPADWTCGVTGGGSPKWAIEADFSRQAGRTFSSSPAAANFLGA